MSESVLFLVKSIIINHHAMQMHLCWVTQAIVDDFYDNAFVNVVYEPKTAAY